MPPCGLRQTPGQGARGDCRAPDPGRGGGPEPGRGEEPLVFPSDGGVSREPEIGAGRGLPAPAVGWVWGSSGVRFARRRVPCGGRSDAQPSGLGRTPPARAGRVTGPFLRSTSPPSPRNVLGLGIRPRAGRPAGRYSAGDGRMLRSPDLAGCLGPGATLAAAFFPIIPATLTRVD